MLKRNLKSIYAAGLAALFSGFLTSAFAQDLVDLPRDLEIELALSALPPELQNNATVYLRDPQKGFFMYRQGTNEWATFVARTSVRFYQADWEYEYPSDQLIPVAFDKIGMAHHAIPYFDIELMRINRMPAKEAKKIIRQRFNAGIYKAPPQGGLSYMLAPLHRAYMAPAQSDQIMTVSFPHYMPYAPDMIKEKLGVMDPYGRSGTLDHGGDDTGPHGYFYFMVQQDQMKAIGDRYADLLGRLCKLHANWCLTKE